MRGRADAALRKERIMTIRTALGALALILPASADAHGFWLQPEDYTPVLREPVEIAFKVGDAGDVEDWGLYWERIAAFQLYGPDGVVDQQQAVRITGEDEPGSAQIALIEPGSYVLAFASNPSFSDLEAQRFDRYVDQEGLSAVAADRAARPDRTQNGTELYARRAKTLLQVGQVLTENVTRPIGQTLEIVPLVNPFRSEVAQSGAGPLPLQVLWRGKPLEGATLSAAALDDTGEATMFTTDADGMVTIRAWAGQATLFSVVWGVPAPDDARADYFTIFASLTVGAE